MKPPGLVAATQALRYWERRQEVVSNNLANADTTGFKGERVFARLLQGTVVGPEAATDYRAGALTTTDAPLDLALEGDGFFVVQTPGRADPFASSPSGMVPGTKAKGDTIAYYDDPSLRVYEFHQHGVAFQLAGRGSLTRLDQLAKQIYVQAYRRK